MHINEKSTYALIAVVKSFVDLADATITICTQLQISVNIAIAIQYVYIYNSGGRPEIASGNIFIGIKLRNSMHRYGVYSPT